MGVSERFHAAYVVAPNGCWLWSRPIHVRGYGRIWDGSKVVGAHRLSYELHSGPIPSGLFVCHRCDEPTCVNPEHLFLGTNADNAADCKAKGRTRKGIDHNQAKLTDDAVRSVREALAAGDRQRDIAKRFGVSQRCVSSIHRRVTWGHVS